MPKTTRRPPVPVSAAMRRAQHHPKPARLAHEDDVLLEEMLRVAQDVSEQIEDSLRSYGRLLLAKVFGNDTKTALAGRADNRVWNDLLRRAGGPTLRLSRKTLEVVLRLAAYDRRIQDEAFRGLDLGRKERLLPLGEEPLMRAAAQHVAKCHLTTADTESYVTALMLEHGKRRQVRATVPTLVARAARLRESLVSESTLGRIEATRKRLSVEDRASMAAEMDELASAVKRIAKLLRAR